METRSHTPLTWYGSLRVNESTAPRSVASMTKMLPTGVSPSSCDERSGRDDVDAVLDGAVEMDAVVAIMLRPRRQDVLLIERVDDEQHGWLPVWSPC